MNQKEFAEFVTATTDFILKLGVRPDILCCACIEAACNIALAENKKKLMVTKLHEAADLLEKVNEPSN